MSTDTTTLVSEINGAAAAISEAMKAFQEKLRAELSPKLSALVAKHSEVIEAFRWRQYAPYFNDGDACEFRVYDDPEFLLSPTLRQLLDEETGEGADEFVDSYALNDFTGYESYGRGWVPPTVEAPTELVEKLRLAIDEIEEVVSALADSSIESAMEAVFGSDNIVTVTAEGVESEEYGDHD
jgi:hypothetical protein